MSNDHPNPNADNQSKKPEKGKNGPALPGPGENPDFPGTDTGTGSGGGRSNG